MLYRKNTVNQFMEGANNMPALNKLSVDDNYNVKEDTLVLDPAQLTRARLKTAKALYDLELNFLDIDKLSVKELLLAHFVLSEVAATSSNVITGDGKVYTSEDVSFSPIEEEDANLTDDVMQAMANVFNGDTDTEDEITEKPPVQTTLAEVALRSKLMSIDNKANIELESADYDAIINYNNAIIAADQAASESFVFSDTYGNEYFVPKEFLPDDSTNVITIKQDDYADKVDAIKRTIDDMRLAGGAEEWLFDAVEEVKMDLDGAFILPTDAIRFEIPTLKQDGKGLLPLSKDDFIVSYPSNDKLNIDDALDILNAKKNAQEVLNTMEEETHTTEELTDISSPVISDASGDPVEEITKEEETPSPMETFISKVNEYVEANISSPRPQYDNNVVSVEKSLAMFNATATGLMCGSFDANAYIQSPHALINDRITGETIHALVHILSFNSSFKFTQPAVGPTIVDISKHDISIQLGEKGITFSMPNESVPVRSFADLEYMLNCFLDLPLDPAVHTEIIIDKTKEHYDLSPDGSGVIITGVNARVPMDGQQLANVISNMYSPMMVSVSYYLQETATILINKEMIDTGLVEDAYGLDMTDMISFYTNDKGDAFYVMGTQFDAVDSYNQIDRVKAFFNRQHSVNIFLNIYNELLETNPVVIARRKEEALKASTAEAILEDKTFDLASEPETVYISGGETQSLMSFEDWAKIDDDGGLIQK
jgi:hypothetical protein